jgi:hypothetical protein
MPRYSSAKKEPFSALDQAGSARDGGVEDGEWMAYRSNCDESRAVHALALYVCGSAAANRFMQLIYSQENAARLIAPSSAETVKCANAQSTSHIEARDGWQRGPIRSTEMPVDAVRGTTTLNLGPAWCFLSVIWSELCDYCC